MYLYIENKTAHAANIGGELSNNILEDLIGRKR